MQVAFHLSYNESENEVIWHLAAGCPFAYSFVPYGEVELSDLAVVFGVYKKHVPMSYARGAVIEAQRKAGKDVLIIETGYINRGAGLEHHYALGLNGLNGRADFRNSGMPRDRADLLGVELKPWKEGGDYVLLCGQVPWDASVDFTDHVAWLYESVKQIRGHTKRHIVFRPHPLAKLPQIDGCGYSLGPLRDALVHAWCCVTFNSNTGVDAALAGVPVFAFDKGSMAWPVAASDLYDIETPIRADRQQWLSDLAYAQWTPAEMAAGLPWEHLFRAIHDLRRAPDHDSNVDEARGPGGADP